MTKTRWLVLGVFAALIVAFFGFGLHHYFTLENLRQSRAAIDAYRDAHPMLASVAFFLTYIAVTGLSLPGAGILTLAAGAIFGLLWGLVIVSFASSIGATIAFLTSRFLLHDAIQKRFGEKLKAINAGVRRDGAFYVITLRLIPVFPFFIINLVMGLTPIPTRTFYWASQLGMIPVTAVFVNAGRELGKIESLKDILSPTLLASLVLLGVFPLIARKVVEKINERRHKKA
jgi:uncharacterized membrane protein YdjX (TVP38/TMEM64 family)